MHCSLGTQWTDHHTLAIITSQDGRTRFDHSAFEAIDLDDVVQGGEYLKSRGHAHSWGIGRHIQGSQIFDYWRDPFGNKVEHWTDGDLVNDSTPVGAAPFSLDELRQWAPPLTPEFFAQHCAEHIVRLLNDPHVGFEDDAGRFTRLMRSLREGAGFA